MSAHDVGEDDDDAFTSRLAGTEREFCLDKLRRWIDEVGADAFRAMIAATPGSPDWVTLAREAGVSKPDSDLFEHDLSLMRHHVPDLGEAVTEALQEASTSRGP